MQFLPIFFILSLFQQVLSAPIVITRMHTAPTVTVVDTYTTVTNTHTAPTVEILVSDGVTYTFTLTDFTAAEPTTFTSYVNRNADDPTTNAATTNSVESKTTTTLSPDITDDSGDNATVTTPGADSQTTAGAQDTAQVTAQTAIAQTANAQTANAQTANAQTANAQTTTAQTTTLVNTPATTLQASTAPTTSTSTTSTVTTTAATTSSAITSTTSTTSATATDGKLNSVPTAIVYSPYNNDNSCKDSATVLADLTIIKSAGIPTIRIYGTDCSSIQTIEPNALNLGLKINQGFWITSAGADSIDDGVDELIAWGQANTWDVFDYITVGNEAVLAGYVTVDELIAKIASVRAKLEAAGYTGKITTSEPPVTFENNPSLCNDAAIDFVGVNPHAYFDTYSSAETAGDFVKGQVDIVKGYCSKDIVVTETGYPSAGIVNGGNVPSLSNQKIAIQKILEAMSNEVTILSTYNDYWKDAGPYGIEQSFGTIQLWA